MISGLRKRLYKGECRESFLHAGIVMFLRQFTLAHLVPTVSSLSSDQCRQPFLHKMVAIVSSHGNDADTPVDENVLASQSLLRDLKLR